MSYKCQICEEVVPRGARAINRVANTREKYYPHRAKANKGYQTRKGRVLRPLRKSRKRADRIDDPGGKGWEIAKEIRVCAGCKED